MHKNWTSIYAIRHHNLRWALVTIEAESEEGRKLAIAFPECFSSEVKEEPIPLDAVLRVAREFHLADPESVLNVERACEKLAVPYVTYAITKRQFEQNDIYRGYVSRDWHRANSRKIGAIVELDGNTYVVLDNRAGELVLASAARVSV